MTDSPGDPLELIDASLRHVEGGGRASPALDQLLLKHASPDSPKSQGASWQGTVDAWVGRGAPLHVAQGIADRVGAESGFKFDLISPDTGGPSAGGYQAHKERMTDLLKLPNWKDANVQHDWAYGQVTGGDAIATKHWNEILSAPTRKEAARLWDKYFERSAAGVGKGGGSNQRVALGQSFEEPSFPALDGLLREHAKRRSAALPITTSAPRLSKLPAFSTNLVAPTPYSPIPIHRMSAHGLPRNVLMTSLGRIMSRS